jgi:hypothetical protein
MKQFDLDKWLVERYSPLTLERIKKAHFNYDDVIEILNAALRQPPVVGRSEQLKPLAPNECETCGALIDPRLSQCGGGCRL